MNGPEGPVQIQERSKSLQANLDTQSNSYEVVESVEYRVPSQSTVGMYYTVAVYDGDARCDCRWGRKEDAPSKCWHVRFVRLIHTAETWIDHVNMHVAEAARAGDVSKQLYVLYRAAHQLNEAGSHMAASRVAEVMAKYLQAISIQGAPPVEEPDAVLAKQADQGPREWDLEPDEQELVHTIGERPAVYCYDPDRQEVLK